MPVLSITYVAISWKSAIGTGWAEGGDALMDGIRVGGPFMEGDDGYWPVLDEFQCLESFHAFAHHPSILDMLDKLFGEKTLVHPRNIGRIMFPENTKYTTPAHQDFIHIRGTEETYTAWIPLRGVSERIGRIDSPRRVASRRCVSRKTRTRCRWTRY